MSLRSLLAGPAILGVSAVLFAPWCMGDTIVDAGDGRYFNYGWGPLNQTNTQWYDDTDYINNLSHYTYQAGPDSWVGYVHLTKIQHSPPLYQGSVQWHFQTDVGKPFGDNVTVTYRVNNFDEGYGCWGEWSTDGSTYTEFFYHPGHATNTVALKDSGFAGGEDLYIRFSGSVVGTFNYDNTHQIQFFRQTSTSQYSSGQRVAVNPEQAPIPEPSTVAALTGLLGMGLIGYRWRRRKAA